MAKKKNALKKNKNKNIPKIYDSIDASPVKSFFVEMLTRDISLEDAILDLLDNCIDGVLRTKGKRKVNKPYDGFYANIEFNRKTFSITDNCGGIPWDLHNYAFRMGRPDPDRDNGIATVGVYGIGMKRAIFKLGKDCSIITKHRNDSYEVKFSEDWIDNANEWQLPVKESFSLAGNGTTVTVKKLKPAIAKEFGNKNFLDKLENIISTSYAFIIENGFCVRVNGKKIKPKTISLKLSGKGKNAINPYVYKAENSGVEIFVTVGFTSPTVGDADQDRLNYTGRSSSDSGWTIICNDRVVIRCDKTELTGWGVSGVPGFHYQFIGIAGIVEFRSKNASKLPTTTTKRSIDASSGLYLRVKDRMVEGMKLFTNYTNEWKGKDLLKESNRNITAAKSLTLQEIKVSKKLKMSATKPKTSSDYEGKVFKPKLPRPSKKKKEECRITFVQPQKDVELVSDYLFGYIDKDSNSVGVAAFEHVFEHVREENE